MKKDENPYHILVIEDNIGDYVILEEYLSEYLSNLHIEHVENFKDASELLGNGENQFNLVFLDLSLPDKSGENLVVDIAQLAKGIPIVVLTGFADLEFGSRSLGLGATDYLVKDDLSAAVLYKSLLYNIQREKINSELKESQSKYADLFQLNPSPIIVYDQQTLKIIDINEAASKKYGYSRVELLSMDLKDISTESEVGVLLSSVDDIRVNTGESCNRITRHCKKNGELIDVEISPAKIRIHNRDAGLMLINDITENLNYIRKVEEQNETLKEITWIQSHVVRAPLARLMGLVNLLESDEGDLTEESKELLGYIKISAEELDQVVRSISDKSERISKN